MSEEEKNNVKNAVENREWLIDELKKSKFTMLPSIFLPLLIGSGLKLNEIRIALLIACIQYQQKYLSLAYVNQKEIAMMTEIHPSDVSVAINSLLTQDIILSGVDDVDRAYYTINNGWNTWKVFPGSTMLEYYLDVRNQHASLNSSRARKKKPKETFNPDYRQSSGKPRSFEY